MNTVILDTETTGIEEPRIVEAAFQPLASLHPAEWDARIVSERFNPGKAISLGALATHHIAEEDLANCRPSESFELPSGTEYVIGHNVDFDMKAIGEPPVRRICTLALCRKFWPAADSHGQVAMLYLLEREFARWYAVKAHSAEADVHICSMLLRHILVKLGSPTDIAELWAASEVARVPEVMTFGKHKGVRIKDVPTDYKRWLLGQPDVDKYLRQALSA